MNNRKKQRKIELLWNKLAKIGNFLIPETIEDYTEFDLFKSPSIKIRNKECFFKKELMPLFNELVDEIYKIDTLKTHVTYNTVYTKVKDQIQETLLSNLEGVSKSFNDIFPVLLTQIANECKNYDFFWQVKGISISDKFQIDFGGACLFVFDKNDMVYVENLEKDVSFRQSVKSTIEESLLNKTCIKCNCYGDIGFAETLGLNKAQMVLNIFRFMFCYLYPEYVYQNVIKINLVTNMMVGKDNFISINHDDKSVTLHWDSSKSARQDYPVNQELINAFKVNCFWDDLVLILTKDQKNDLEKALSNAIYWIGEAQNEWTPQIAFIKFWTAIEALTYNLPNNKDVTNAIITNVSTLLIYGGYHYFHVDEYWKLRELVSKLYGKRSRIIHDGVLETVDHNELSKVCKYSTQMVSEFLFLCSLGYSKFEQVREQAERLHENHLKIKASREKKEPSTS